MDMNYVCQLNILMQDLENTREVEVRLLITYDCISL